MTGWRAEGRFPAQISLGAQDHHPQVAHYTAIVREVSEYPRVEAARRTFVSMVSHEMRTPLTSIMGGVRFVLWRDEDVLPQRTRELLEMAYRNSERLTTLLNDILDQERIESGQIAFDFQPVDLQSLARIAVDDNEGYAQAQGVRLVVESGVAQAPVCGDAQRLLQVFANLLSNGIKHSPEGAPMTVTVQPLAEVVRVIICDHGPGIPADLRSQLFTPFAQGPQLGPDAPSGSGLGLRITKGIVERHGGRIDLTRERGTGTCFFFELPVRSTANP